MKNVAETLRWIGFMTMTAGGLGAVVTAGVAVAPLIAAAAIWAVAQIGLTAILASLFFVGYGIFYIGEMISPHQPRSNAAHPRS